MVQWMEGCQSHSPAWWDAGIPRETALQQCGENIFSANPTFPWTRADAAAFAARRPHSKHGQHASLQDRARALKPINAGSEVETEGASL